MGFTPIETTDGADWHGKLREVNIPAAVANVFLGDMVNTEGGGGSTDGRAESVALATAGDFAAGTTTAIVGAIVGFFPDFTDEGSLTRNYHLTGSDQRAKLVYGTDVIYESEDDDGSLAVTDINAEKNITVGAGGDTITGISSFAIDSSSTPAAGAGQLRILGYSRTEGDDTGAPPIGNTGAKWRCRLQNSSDDHGITGV